jgi:hypothetical protein
MMGIGLGGILVIIGIVLRSSGARVGIIVALVGLAASAGSLGARVLTVAARRAEGAAQHR